jgi:uncharacterized damage-inducible protein DinB
LLAIQTRDKEIAEMAENFTKKVLLQRWEQISSKLEALAEELPAEALEHVPIGGARSYGAVLRHVAFWNQYVADTLRGKDADDALNELPISEYPSKLVVLRALSESSQAVLSALGDRPSLDQKSTEMLISFIEHNSEHYGQLVVYSRLLGIVPVSSRA